MLHTKLGIDDFIALNEALECFVKNCRNVEPEYLTKIEIVAAQMVNNGIRVTFSNNEFCLHLDDYEYKVIRHLLVGSTKQLQVFRGKLPRSEVNKIKYIAKN